MKTILRLFFRFMKIGAFTFGGGYAMIPFIEREAVDNENWITKEDIIDIVAIAESTPGPIAVNMATFVGYKVAGFFGAFFATLGVCLPAFLIISILSYAISLVYSNIYVSYAFYGIRAGVLALICKALYSMYRQCPKSVLSYILMAASFIGAAVLGLNALWVILICAVFGLVFSFVAGKRGGVLK